jgi:hypothetical protein
VYLCRIGGVSVQDRGYLCRIGGANSKDQSSNCALHLTETCVQALRVVGVSCIVQWGQLCALLRL